MELCNGDLPLIVKNNGNNLEVRNYRKTDENESVPICKLNDFFSNNIDFELSQISILQLENCDLNEIPSAIQKLNLTQLILTRNKLREIPSCLYSGLNALKLLDLSHNFIESFDIEPACSCTIVTLKVNNNKIRNFPHWILNLRCPKLTEVVYSYNHVMDLRASHQLNIKKLEMCNCQLIDVDFSFFKSLRSLEHLNISNIKPVNHAENYFKDIDLLFINTRWKNLKVLNLSNLPISILPQGVFWITSLTELYLNNCELSWIPFDIKFLTNLKILDVSENSICALPKELAGLKNLVIIKAPFNTISSVPDFSHSLQVLDLYNNSLEAYPACVNNVKFIDLEQNYFKTENCDNYNKKRDQWREMFLHNRIDGPKELPEQQPDSDSDHQYDSEGSVHYEDNSDEAESDNWDEEKPDNKPVILPQRNPEITSSDDEWDGKAEIRKTRIRIPAKQNKFDLHEDWFFCDAEE